MQSSLALVDLANMMLGVELKAKLGDEVDLGFKEMATNDRLLGKPGYLHDFPGLAVESVHWLADRGIGMFGVEAVSPAPEGEPSTSW